MPENAAESPASSAPQKMSEHHFEREKQGRMKDWQPGEVYSEVAGMQAEESNGEVRAMRFPWCTVVFGRIDLRIGGVRVVIHPSKDQD